MAVKPTKSPTTTLSGSDQREHERRNSASRASLQQQQATRLDAAYEADQRESRKSDTGQFVTTG
jgi:hypothetical protein